MAKRGVIKFQQQEERGDYDEMLLSDKLGLPYMPQQVLYLQHSISLYTLI